MKLQLEANKHEITLGEPFSISIRLQNTGDQGTFVVGVLDGSEQAIRFPHYIPTIRGPLTEPDADFICGTVLPIKEKYFRMLEPGESFDPTEKVDSNEFHDIFAFKKIPAAKGEYNISLTYSTDSTSTTYWLGQGINTNDLSKVEGLISKVPKLTIPSNRLKITVI